MGFGLNLSVVGFYGFGWDGVALRSVGSFMLIV